MAATLSASARGGAAGAGQIAAATGSGVRAGSGSSGRRVRRAAHRVRAARTAFRRGSPLRLFVPLSRAADCVAAREALAMTSLPPRRVAGTERRAECVRGEVRSQPLPQAPNGAGVELRDARLVHPDLRSDLLHREVAVVVAPDDRALPPRQSGDGDPNAPTDLGALAHLVRCGWLGGHQHRRKVGAIDRLGRGERRCRFDRVDPHDGAAQLGLVRIQVVREVGEGRLAAQLVPQILARRLQLPAHAPHAPRPGVAPQGVDHRAAHAALGEGLELDPARLVEAMRCVNQTRSCRPERGR